MPSKLANAFTGRGRASSEPSGLRPASARLRRLRQTRSTSPASAGGRIEAIDFARGVAVALMILSHGVKGLLGFGQIPAWGMVPIHLITKLSSSLFIVVFGISLAVAYLPHADDPSWPRRRRKLWVRGLVVLFWYKVLTIVEMVHLYTPDDILDALLYRAFPVYVEILGFYAIALLWIPLALPLWKRLPVWLRLTSPVAVAALSAFLYRSFHFWHLEALQAILVEHEQHYTWGQLSRAPLVMLGLLIGETLRPSYWRPEARAALARRFGMASAVLFALFGLGAFPEVPQALMSIARNEGKHPPEPSFMLFSIGGALSVLAAALWGGEPLARLLKPITVIGRNALQAFVFHIFVIFVFFRFLLGYWHRISYGHALTLTVFLILSTAIWIKTLDWVRQRA